MTDTKHTPTRGPWWIVTHEWQGCQQMSSSKDWYSSATLCHSEAGARVHIGLLSLGLSPRPGYVTNRNISEPIQVAPLPSHDALVAALKRQHADLTRELERMAALMKAGDFPHVMTIWTHLNTMRNGAAAALKAAGVTP